MRLRDQLRIQIQKRIQTSVRFRGVEFAGYEPEFGVVVAFALDEGGGSWGPYRVSGLPAAVIIDQNGIVRWRGR